MGGGLRGRGGAGVGEGWATRKFRSLKSDEQNGWD